jgi:hypothetical protein
LVERHYTIAGLGVTMRFAGDAMVDRLGSAIAHLESPTSAADPALTLDVWDSASTGVEPPPMTGGEEFDTDETGPSYYYERDGIRAMNRWRTLSVLDLDAGAGWFWAPDAARIVSWDWAAPFRTIFHWWLGSRGAFQVHGGAVGLPEAGVIVVGRGGSGKSRSRPGRRRTYTASTAPARWSPTICSALRRYATRSQIQSGAPSTKRSSTSATSFRTLRFGGSRFAQSSSRG